MRNEIIRRYNIVVYKPVPPLNKFDFDGWKLKSKQGRFGDEGATIFYTILKQENEDLA